MNFKLTIPSPNPCPIQRDMWLCDVESTSSSMIYYNIFYSFVVWDQDNYMTLAWLIKIRGSVDCIYMRICIWIRSWVSRSCINNAGVLWKIQIGGYTEESKAHFHTKSGQNSRPTYFLRSLNIMKKVSERIIQNKMWDKRAFTRSMGPPLLFLTRLINNSKQQQ